MKQSQLRARLRELDESLANRFSTIEIELQKLLEYSQAGSHMTFTPHGLSHIRRLEHSYDWLLSANDIETQFNATEIFVLLLATYTHDLLMIPRRPGDEASARETHARSVESFLRDARAVHVSIHEAQAVSEVVRGHHVNALTELPSDLVLGTSLVEVRKLAACLSLADIRHADESRAPAIVFDHHSFDETSAWHWRRHLQIGGITRRGSELVMSAYYFSDSGEEAVRDYVDSIDQQLQIIRPYFDSQLEPITGVKLLGTRKRSPIDTPISFDADVPAVLRLLIDGVYQHDDVFVRELVQNALDATYIQQAKAFKGSARYTPRIIITCLVDPDGQVIAVRVDDNGIGMSIREVQDTLLTVASSQRNSTVVQQLLKESGKQLIATFGIGLLSCLKVATSVEVRTYRDGEIPVELSLAGVEREVRPREGSPDTVGTSIIVRLDTSRSPALEFDDAIEAYLVQVRQADVYLHTTIDEDVLDCPRSDMFALAQEGAFDLVEAFDPSPIEFSWELGAESFDGWVWIDASEPADAISQMRVGKMTILNDGIYVTDSDSDEWLDPELSYLTGMLNFRAGALNLAASRDAVRLDTRYEAMRREVTARARNYIGYLANMTRHRQPISGSSWKPHSRADLPLLAISSTYRALVTNKQPVEWLLRQLDGYSAELFGGALRELQHFGSPAEQSLYATYFSGRTVDDLGTFNNYPLYYKPDAVSKLESLLLVDSGKDVLFARTFDTNPRINEFDLLKAYFSRHGRQLVDVVRAQRFDVPIRSRGISKRARAHIGSGVKFLDFPAFPEQMAWRLQGETWLNTSNPRIAGLHRLLARDDITVEQLIPAKMLIDLLGFKFDDVVNHLLSALILDDAPLA